MDNLASGKKSLRVRVPGYPVLTPGMCIPGGVQLQPGKARSGVRLQSPTSPLARQGCVDSGSKNSAGEFPGT
eukprot:1070520-Rhodomonas_salina.1